MRINFEELKCNLCGEEKYKHLVKCKIEESDTVLPIDYMSLVKCSNCGLVYVNPRPDYSKQEMEKEYSEDYYEAPYMKYYMEKGGVQSNESFESRLNWIEEYSNKGRILDIGCASGLFLKIARDRGWEVFGVDISDAAASMAREKHRLNVVAGQLGDAEYESGFFDAVAAGDVMEHVEDPKSFLIEVSRILKKDGILYIAVPDFDGLIYKVSLAVAKIDHKNYFTLPHHIFNFNKNALSRYLTESNFELIEYKKSESNINPAGFRGKIELLVFMIARLIGQQDRVLFLARK